MSNKRYLRVIAKKKAIESKLYEYNEELNSEQRALEERIKKSKRVLSGLLVNQFSSDKSLTGLVGQKIMIEELANEVKNLNKSLEKIKDQKKRDYRIRDPTS